MTPLRPPPSCLLTRSLVLCVISEPLFPFQSFTKNFFSSPLFLSSQSPPPPLLPSCPHICSSITRLGVVSPGESCDPLSEEKGEVCVQKAGFSGPAGRSKVNSTLIQWVRAAQGVTRFFSLGFSSFLFFLFFLSLQFITIVSFFSAAWPLVWPRCLPSKPEAGCD